MATLGQRAMPPEGVLGVGIGATLCKLALRRGGLHTEQGPSADLNAMLARMGALAPERIVVTGGGAERLGPALAGMRVEYAGEFDAWARGAALVAADEGV